MREARRQLAAYVAAFRATRLSALAAGQAQPTHPARAPASQWIRPSCCFACRPAASRRRRHRRSTTHEPVFVEPRPRRAPDQRQRERQRCASQPIAPSLFSTRVAEPLPAMPEDRRHPSDAVDAEPDGWDAQDVADPGAERASAARCRAAARRRRAASAASRTEEPAMLDAARRPARPS